MVRLVVEAPLTNDQVRARILHTPDHVQKLLLFITLELFELLDARDVEFMLRLGSRRLEWTGEDGDACIFQSTRHLWV